MRQILKPIVIGLLLGAGIFFMPFFILKVFLFFLIIGIFFRIFGGRRHRGYKGPMRWAYADKVRNMGDEEYQEFKSTYKHAGRCGWGNRDSETAKTEKS